MLKKYFQKWYKLIGLVIILLVLWRADLKEIGSSIVKADKFYLMAGLFLIILVAFIRSWRWNYIKKTQQINYSLSDSFAMYCVGIFMGILTPGKIGDFFKMFYLKKKGYSSGRSIFSIVLDRLSDVLFLLIFGYIGIIIFGQFFKHQIFYFSLIFLSGLILFYIIIKPKYSQKILKIFISRLIPSKYKKSWHVNVQDFIDDCKNLKIKNYTIIFLITILSWSVYYIEILFFAKSVGINNVPILYIILSVTIAGFVTLIPISYLGIGTRDIILISLFSVFSVSKELSVAFSSLILSTHLLMSTVGFVYWQKKPLKLT